MVHRRSARRRPARVGLKKWRLLRCAVARGKHRGPGERARNRIKLEISGIALNANIFSVVAASGVSSFMAGHILASMHAWRRREMLKRNAGSSGSAEMAIGLLRGIGGNAGERPAEET